MAASGFTPISLYYSTTASAVPTSGNLANGELGLNIADMKLYAKNSAGTVTLLASSGGATGTVSSVSGTGTVNGLTLTGTVTTSGSLTLGGTLSGVNLTSQVTGTLPTANGGTNLTSFTSGGVVYASSSSALTTGAMLVFDSSDRFIVGASSATVGNRMEVVANTSSEAIAIRGRVSDGGGHISWHPNASSTLYAKIESNNTSVLNFYTGSTLRFQFGSAGQFGIGGATYGNVGEVLTSAGSGAPPTWVAASGGGAGAFVAFGSTGGM